jgi:hypothetical protein
MLALTSHPQKEFISFQSMDFNAFANKPKPLIPPILQSAVAGTNGGPAAA